MIVSTRRTLIVLASTLGVVLVVMLLLGAAGMAAAAEGENDLGVTLRAPEHVAPDSTFVINLAYSNTGTIASPADTWASITLPDGVSFVEATDRQGTPLAPDQIQGNTITWVLGALPAGECCGHILITVQTASDLPEETALQVSAEIGSSAAETNLANNTASVTSTICDMAGSTKQVQAREVKPGDILTYTITLNLAKRMEMTEMQSRQVTLTDTLPNQNQVRFLGWTGEVQGEVDGQELRWQGQVRAGEPLKLEYRLGVVGDVVSGTVITNGAHLAWRGGKFDIDPVTTTVTLPPYARMIGPQGYTWQHEQGVDIEVPPHTVTDTTRFEFRPITDTQKLQGPPGWMFAHQAFELTAFRFGEVNQFGQPITLTVHFKPEDLTGLKQNTLRLWYRNGPGEAWKMLGEPLQSGPGYLSFQTNHFTEFALFGEANFHIHLPMVLGK